MTTWIAVCERTRANMGRNRNQTYINVIVGVRRVDGVDTLADWLTANPGHPWNDSLFNEFIVEISEAQFSAVRNGTNPLSWDGNFNLPRWQQQNTGSGSALSIGHWTDPTDSSSVWNAQTPLSDPRWIVRIYDGDPGAGGTHIAREDFDEDQASPTVVRYLKLFNSDDTPSTTNAQNQKVEVGGFLLDLDFTNGVATFNVHRDEWGVGTFPSNYSYRVVGPSGEGNYAWRVFAKGIRVELR